MCGRSGHDRRGQLALMDALVFFAIAITISSILLFYTRPDEENLAASSRQGRSDPRAVLQVFLHSSVGKDVTISLESGFHVAENAEVEECLALELDALASGVDITAFEDLNEALIDVINATCSPVMDPCLMAFLEVDTGLQTLLVLSSEPQITSTRLASSVELPGRNGSIYLVELLLVPASSPEIQ